MVEHQQLEQKLCTPLEVQRMYLKKTTPSKKFIITIRRYHVW